MRKVISLALSFVILVMPLSGCVKDVEPKSSSDVSSVQSQSEETSSQSVSFDNLPKFTLDLLKEPPISEYVMKMPVPDFLDEEQQNLYRRAKEASHFLLMDASDIDSYLPPDGKDYRPNDGAIVDDVTPAYNRYHRWSNFEAMILSVFTQGYFDTINNSSPNFKQFRNVDGILYHGLGARGSNMNASDIPDEFKLVSKSEKEIKFNVIGHYVDFKEDETDEERYNRAKTSYDFTKSYPITMVKNENGWRFSEFNITT